MLHLPYRELPLEDPGTPDRRSPARYLWWVARNQRTTLILATFFGVTWMLSQALLWAAVGGAIDHGVATGDGAQLIKWVGVVLALGLVLGIVAVRVRGISFVIITLAMGQVLWGLAYQWVGLSEGDNGIPLPTLPAIGPLDLGDPLTLRMTVLAVFAVVALLMVTFTRSPFGLSLRGIRSNETRLAALGYRTGLQRYLAWVIATFFTGVAGVLYVFVNQLISPATMDFAANGLFVLMVVLGGLGSIWGPALGAVVIQPVTVGGP